MPALLLHPRNIQFSAGSEPQRMDDRIGDMNDHGFQRILLCAFGSMVKCGNFLVILQISMLPAMLGQFRHEQPISSYSTSTIGRRSLNERCRIIFDSSGALLNMVHVPISWILRNKKPFEFRFANRLSDYLHQPAGQTVHPKFCMFHQLVPEFR